MVAVLPDYIRPDWIYSPAQAADALGVGATTLWRYAQQGLIAQYRRPGCQRKSVYTGRDIIKLHRTIEIV